MSLAGLKGKDHINAATAKRAAASLYDLMFPED